MRRSPSGSSLKSTATAGSAGGSKSLPDIYSLSVREEPEKERIESSDRDKESELDVPLAPLVQQLASQTAMERTPFAIDEARDDGEDDEDSLDGIIEDDDELMMDEVNFSPAVVSACTCC